MNITKKSLALAVTASIFATPLIAVNAQEINATADFSASSNVQTPQERPLPPKAKAVGQFKIEKKEINADVKAQMKAQHSSTTVREMRAKAHQENPAKVKATADLRKREIAAKLLVDRKGDKMIKLQADAKARVRARLGNIFMRLDQHLAKVANIDAKIALRLNTLDGEGKNVEEASTQFKVAQTSLEKSKAEVSAVKALAAEKTATTSPATSKETIHSLVKAADVSIRATIEEYKKTIELLRNTSKAEIQADAQASTTTTQ